MIDPPQVWQTRLSPRIFFKDSTCPLKIPGEIQACHTGGSVIFWPCTCWIFKKNSRWDPGLSYQGGLVIFDHAQVESLKKNSRWDPGLSYRGGGVNHSWHWSIIQICDFSVSAGFHIGHHRGLSHERPMNIINQFTKCHMLCGCAIFLCCSHTLCFLCSDIYKHNKLKVPCRDKYSRFFVVSVVSFSNFIAF